MTAHLLAAALFFASHGRECRAWCNGTSAGFAVCGERTYRSWTATVVPRGGWLRAELGGQRLELVRERHVTAAHRRVVWLWVWRPVK